jgi:hypothetical protein
MNNISPDYLVEKIRELYNLGHVEWEPSKILAHCNKLNANKSTELTKAIYQLTQKDAEELLNRAENTREIKYNPEFRPDNWQYARYWKDEQLWHHFIDENEPDDSPIHGNIPKWVLERRAKKDS